jgi:RNA polymerase sigma-70 factor, ECF subfamily
MVGRAEMLHRGATKMDLPPRCVDLRAMQEDTEELLDRFAGGDAAGYEALFRRYHGPLRRFVLGHTDARFRGLVPVDDLMQEVHLQALASLPRFSYRRELAFFLWLCGIARRLIANHCRRLRRRPPPVSASTARTRGGGLTSHDLLDAARCDAPTPIQQATLNQHLDLLAAGLEGLPARRRRAVVLRYIEGLGGDEAADEMGLSANAFRSLLSRALLQLREALDHMLGGESVGPGG